jgi:hypothetical protein
MKTEKKSGTAINEMRPIDLQPLEDMNARITLFTTKDKKANGLY